MVQEFYNEKQPMNDAFKANIRWMIDNELLHEAKKMLADYEEAEKDDTAIYSIKAAIAMKEMNYEYAVEKLLEGCAWDSGNSDMLYELGCACLEINERALATGSFEQAIRNTDDRQRQEFIYQTMKAMGEERSLEDITGKKVTKIYILCIAEVATGGTELLHQLCHKLSKIGCEAYMWYGNNAESPVADRFKKYHTRYVSNVYDAEESVFIIPEVMPQIAISIKAKKVILWWLSVDNFLRTLLEGSLDEKHVFDLIKGKDDDSRILHYAQSQYAINYLLQRGINPREIYYLSDYLNEEFMKRALSSGLSLPRYANVLYYPGKGYEFTSKLIQASPELNWIPLRNYTPEEMRTVMCRSMVYIDFGNHPGKDRIPREAAICGCCILVGLDGAAANPVDIPIPQEFKVEGKDENIGLIIQKIKYLIQNYEEANSRFDNYRRIIQGEEAEFEKDIRSLAECILEEDRHD